MPSGSTTFTVTSVNSSFDSLCATRYNFLPDSVNKAQGKISIAANGEVSTVLSNANSKKIGDDYCYSGNQVQAKEYEYVLIVDSNTKTARIEKVQKIIMLRNVRRSRRLSNGTSSPSNLKRSATVAAEDDGDEIDQLHADIFGEGFV